MFRLVLLAACVLSLGLFGCDMLQRNDEPLPSFEELRAEFSGQPPGRGLVQEDDDTPYETSAVHFTTGEGELARFWVDMVSEEAGVAMSLFLSGVEGADLQPGMQFETLSVIYGGDAPADGQGRLEITAVEDGRIEGVFAVDLTPRTFNPNFRRLTGGFNAVFEPPGE